MDSVRVSDKICLTIKEASELSNIGINKLDELSKDPKCGFVLYVGRKKLILRKKFETFLENSVEL